MASLFKHPKSPYWSACFTLPDGTRTKRSTGATDRRTAQRIANEFEDAARAAREGRLIEARARRTIADIYALANPKPLGSSSISDFLDAWIKRKELEASEKTLEKYRGVVSQFKEHLGPRRKLDITNITAADIVGFRDALAERLAVGTVNLAVKIMRIAFGQARRDGLVDVNEASRVTILKRPNEQIERRAFSLPELKRIIEIADDQWRGMVLFGLYTGQRLTDIATLTWNNLDLQRAELRLVTGKTGRQQIIPLATPLARYVESLPSSDKPDAPLFPRLYGAGNLSNQFYDILATAGMMPKRSHRANPHKTGRSTRRTQNELSFHCLRHTATSLLKNAGVSEAVAMEFVGHDSKSVSQHYTHIETSALRQAADKMPDITQ